MRAKRYGNRVVKETRSATAAPHPRPIPKCGWMFLQLGWSAPNSRAQPVRGKTPCRFGNAAVGCCYSATTAAKGIPRAGNVRYHTPSTEPCEHAWETRHVQQRATPNGTLNARRLARRTRYKYRFLREDVYRTCYMRPPASSEHISGRVRPKARFYPAPVRRIWRRAGRCIAS